LIDLHTHTTASDGKFTPPELVARAARAGVTVLGVTDHDTMAGCGSAAAACAAQGIEFVTGIEVTAVADERDVHVLGYFLDADDVAFNTFLAEQRERRLDRIRQMVGKLAGHGLTLDLDAVLEPAVSDTKKAAGRPWIARALVEGGHVATISEAFDRWLSFGKPAFVPRIGAAPAEVFARIKAAGGLATLAHPALLKNDAQVEACIASGLDAIEVYHCDHDQAATARYLALARRHNLLVTGGSDFHADDSHGGGAPGKVTLPRADYDRLLEARAARRATASGASISS
jgi:predicted metal-dependent phosphoesterase TrpH